MYWQRNNNNVKYTFVNYIIYIIFTLFSVNLFFTLNLYMRTPVDLIRSGKWARYFLDDSHCIIEIIGRGTRPCIGNRVATGVGRIFSEKYKRFSRASDFKKNSSTLVSWITAPTSNAGRPQFPQPVNKRDNGTNYPSPSIGNQASGASQCSNP